MNAFLYELVTYVEAHMAEVRAVIKKWSTNQEGKYEPGASEGNLGNPVRVCKR